MVEYRMMAIDKAADIALKNRLYVSGWCLSGDLKHYRENASSYEDRLKIVLAYDDDKPVGVVVSDERYGDVQAFVRKSYRRRGIASGAIKHGRIKVRHCGDGIDGSEHFWTHVRKNLEETDDGC
jgi:hypothetical protein